VRAPRRITSGMFATDTGFNPSAAQTVSEAELVILCAFALDRDGRLTGRELRHRLIGAGFRPAATPHLIRSSRLLARSSDGRYGLSDPFPTGDGAT